MAQLSPQVEELFRRALSQSASTVLGLKPQELAAWAIRSPDEVLPPLEELQRRKADLVQIIKKFQVRR